MLFCSMFSAFLLLGGLLTEGILALFLQHKLRNADSYIRIFLLSDGKRTLESYILNSFFPVYFIWLICCLVILLANNIYYQKYMLIVYIVLICLLVIVRLFNRTVFSTIWKVLDNV